MSHHYQSFIPSSNASFFNYKNEVTTTNPSKIDKKDGNLTDSIEVFLSLYPA